jgi:hypothetical protein
MERFEAIYISEDFRVIFQGTCGRCRSETRYFDINEVVKRLKQEDMTELKRRNAGQILEDLSDEDESKSN